MKKFLILVVIVIAFTQHFGGAQAMNNAFESIKTVFIAPIMTNTQIKEACKKINTDGVNSLNQHFYMKRCIH